MGDPASNPDFDGKYLITSDHFLSYRIDGTPYDQNFTLRKWCRNSHLVEQQRMVVADGVFLTQDLIRFYLATFIATYHGHCRHGCE